MTVGGGSARASGVAAPPSMSTIASWTILTTCWAPVIDSSTRSPSARKHHVAYGGLVSLVDEDRAHRAVVGTSPERLASSERWRDPDALDDDPIPHSEVVGRHGLQRGRDFVRENSHGGHELLDRPIPDSLSGEEVQGRPRIRVDGALQRKPDIVRLECFAPATGCDRLSDGGLSRRRGPPDQEHRPRIHALDSKRPSPRSVRGEPHRLRRALAHVHVLETVVSVRDPGPGRVELAYERVHHHGIELRARDEPQLREGGLVREGRAVWPC